MPFFKEIEDKLNSEMLRFYRREVVGHPKHLDVTLLRHKLETGNMWRNYEVQMAETIRSRFPLHTRIVEVASGLGQLSILLSRFGYPTHGVEYIEERAIASARCAASVEVEATFEQGIYPDKPDQEFDLLVGANMLGGPTWSQGDDRVERFLRAPHAVLDIRLLFHQRDDPDDRARVLAMLEAQGYTSENLFEHVYLLEKK